MSLPPDAPPDAQTFALVADPAVCAVVVAAMVILKAFYVSDRSQVLPSLLNDEMRRSVDGMADLLDVAGVLLDGQVLAIASGIAVEGLQFLGVHKPEWFLEGQQLEPRTLPAVTPGLAN